MMPSLIGHVTSCQTRPSAGFNIVIIHRALIVLLVTWKSLGCRVALTVIASRHQALGVKGWSGPDTLTLKGGLNILFLTGSFYVANLNTYGANLGEQFLSL